MKIKLHLLGNKCVLFFLLLTLSQQSYSQLDGGFTLGPSNFLGDLGGNYGVGTGFLKDNNFPMTRMFFGAHLTANVNDYLSFRLAANYGSIAGDDAVIRGKGGAEEFRKIRNLNFKSTIKEAFFVAEIYPLVMLEEDPSDTWHKIRPYGVIGLGVFNFNPQGEDLTTGNWVYLRPLRTEGQAKEYSITSLSVPMGFGAKYFASDNVTISLEVIHRKTFSDNLDDVSTNYVDPNWFYSTLSATQAPLAARMADKTPATSFNRAAGDKRGTPENNDSFFTTGLKVNFRIGALFGGYGGRGSTRCPVMRY